MGKVCCEAVIKILNSGEKIMADASLPNCNPPPAAMLCDGKPLLNFSSTYSIVTRSLIRAVVLASLRMLAAGFNAPPLPRPGRPTRTAKMFGYSLYKPLSTHTCLFNVAAILVAALQKWNDSGDSEAALTYCMYLSIQLSLSFRTGQGPASCNRFLLQLVL